MKKSILAIVLLGSSGVLSMGLTPGSAPRTRPIRPAPRLDPCLVWTALGRGILPEPTRARLIERLINTSVI